MSAFDSEADLARLLHAGYAAPLPRSAFVEDLLGRLRQELRAERAEPRIRPKRWTLRRAAPWLAAAAAVALLIGGPAIYTLVKQKFAGAPLTVSQGPGGAADQSAKQPGPEFQGTAPPPVPAATPAPGMPAAVPPAAAEKMVALAVAYPKALFIGTPKNIPTSPYLEKYDERPRPTFMVPEGTVNLSKGRPVTASDSEPIVGELRFITDGDKEGADGSYVELGHNRQFVQIDLGRTCAIYAILVWHYHGEWRVYHDVVVQVADDPDFIEGARTLYNNDYDNSAGLGIGSDLEYIEDFRGRLIDAKGAAARYVRLYSRGNTANDQNHYIEVEVHGKPAAAPEKMTALNVEYPRAMIFETYGEIPSSPYLEKYNYGPRPAFMVPEGTVNLARGRPVTASDSEPIIGELRYVTDGDKEGTDGSVVELRPGLQFVQIDLGRTCAIYAVLPWRFHAGFRSYRDVIVQVCDDPGFSRGVQTLYNNDYDNSSGLGIGKDLEYIEDYRGRLIDAKGATGRYVRLYSRGNTRNDLNHYIEVEVHGKPAAPAPAAKPVPLSVQLPKPMFE